jgi:hypothetical protein
MSLSQEIFSKFFDGLVTKFKATPNAVIKAAYQGGAINAHFTDDDWIRAVNLCIQRDSFFPTIDRLVELALGDRLQDQAQEDWRWAYYVISGGDIVTALKKITVSGRMALESLGRPQDLGQQSEDYVKTTIRDKFFRAYHTYALRNGLGTSQQSIAIEGDSQREGLRRLFDAQ